MVIVHGSVAVADTARRSGGVSDSSTVGVTVRSMRAHPARSRAAAAATMLCLAVVTHGPITAAQADNASEAAFEVIVEPGQAADDTGAGAAVFDSADVSVDVMALSSKPGADRTIFIDVDGHVIDSSFYSSRYNVDTIVSAAFDLDGNPQSFNNTERDAIYNIWVRVAEDYGPFDINVTTKDPGSAALITNSRYDSSYGTRVVVTSTNWMLQATGGDYGGISAIGSFGTSVEIPSYVFAGGGRTPALLGNLTSHEAGHTFGLLHDGDNTNQYHQGHSDWAPIMGYTHSRNVVQWSKGDYPNATNTEDDRTIISRKAPFAVDDHGNTPDNARPVTVPGVVNGFSGFEDVDMFVIDVAAGPVTVTLEPTHGAASNLAATLTVTNNAGQNIGRVAPTSMSGWRSTVQADVPEGSYTIAVASSGYADQEGSFNTYGSAGSYTLSVTGVGGNQPARTNNPTPADSRRPTRLTSLKPQRVVDTRNGLGGVRVRSGGQLTVDVNAIDGVDTNATAALLNVTVVHPDAAGFVTVHPCGARPETSTLNFAQGAPATASSTVATLENGDICVYTSAGADIIIDVNGFMTPTGPLRFTPVTPRRVVDTRGGVGGSITGPNTVMSVPVNGDDSDLQAVAVNVTAVGASSDGYVTLYPCVGASDTPPPTSTVNFAGDGSARANNAIVAVANGGLLCAYVSADVDVLIDVVGTFAGHGLSYVALPPARIADTRNRIGINARLARASAVSFTFRAGVEQTVEAASVNIAALNPDIAGYVTMYDCTRPPSTSTLNPQQGSAVANGAHVGVHAATTMCLYTSTATDMIVDLNGVWVR